MVHKDDAARVITYLVIAGVLDYIPTRGEKAAGQEFATTSYSLQVVDGRARALLAGHLPIHVPVDVRTRPRREICLLAKSACA